MADWIAVDETTRLALRDALGPHGEISTRTGSALKAALETRQDCALILPIGDGSEAQLVSIQRLRAPEAPVSPQIASPATIAPEDTSRFDYIADEPAEKETTADAKPTSKHVAQTEATGFLGLSDEVVYDDEPEQEKKKSWWEKLTR